MSQTESRCVYSGIPQKKKKNSKIFHVASVVCTCSIAGTGLPFENIYTITVYAKKNITRRKSRSQLCLDADSILSGGLSGKLIAAFFLDVISQTNELGRLRVLFFVLPFFLNPYTLKYSFTPTPNGKLKVKKSG